MRAATDRRALWTNLFAGSLAALAAGTLLGGCVVKESPPANGSSQNASQSKSPDCRARQDACVADCKAKALDEATRQPCYTGCMRRSQGCR